MKIFVKQLQGFLLFPALVIAVGLVLPATPRASKSLLFAGGKKEALLRETPVPRIIFVGGSNVSFGLNCELVKSSLNLNPVNTAIHYALGPQFILKSVLRYVKLTDIVVVALEYEHFYDSPDAVSEELLRTICDVDRYKISLLSLGQFYNLMSFVPKYALTKYLPSEYLNLNVNRFYTVNSFNLYGDAFLHWGVERQKFNPVSSVGQKYHQETMELLIEFNKEIKKRGAVLMVTFPCYQDLSFDNSVAKIKRIEQEYYKNGLLVLGTPERYRMADSLMFNTAYHLGKKGVDYRTQLLIEDLEKKLKQKGDKDG